MVEAGKFDDEINRFIKEVNDSVEENNRGAFDDFIAKDFDVVQSALEMTKEEQDAAKAVGGGSAAENAASSCAAHLTDEEWFIQRMELDQEKLRRLRRTTEAKKNDLNTREAEYLKQAKETMKTATLSWAEFHMELLQFQSDPDFSLQRPAWRQARV